MDVPPFPCLPEWFSDKCGERLASEERCALHSPAGRGRPCGGPRAPNAQGAFFGRSWDRQPGRCVREPGSRVEREGRGLGHVFGSRGPRLSHGEGPPPALPATLQRSTSQSERGPRVRGERGSSPGGASAARRHRVADLFLRQSCIFILDVFPEAYFS